MVQSTVVLLCPTFQEAILLLESFGCDRSILAQGEDTHSFYAGSLPGFPFCKVAVIGIGHRAAEKGLLAFLKKHPQVRELILTGFSGALLRTSQAGDLVIPTSIQSLEGKVQPDLKLAAQLTRLSAKEVLNHLMCSESVVSSTVDKAAMYAATFAQAVDMESYVLGKVCQNTGLSWACIKTILDEADESLSNQWSHVLDHFGRVKWLPLLAKGLTHPHMWNEAMRMRPKVLKKVMEEQFRCLFLWLKTKSRESELQTSAQNPAPQKGQLSFLTP